MRVCDIYWITLMTKENFYAKSDRLRVSALDDARKRDGIPARVTAVHRDRYTLYCEHGEISGRLKAGVYYGDGREEFPTVGDFVLTRANPVGDSQIFATLPRRTFFSRRDPHPRPQGTGGRGQF